MIQLNTRVYPMFDFQEETKGSLQFLNLSFYVWETGKALEFTVQLNPRFFVEGDIILDFAEDCGLTYLSLKRAGDPDLWESRYGDRNSLGIHNIGLYSALYSEKAELLRALLQGGENALWRKMIDLYLEMFREEPAQTAEEKPQRLRRVIEVDHA